MRRRILWLAGAAGLLVVMAFIVWPSRKVNLVLVTLDTTRADRLGCYGYREGRTPVLDALARGGVVCTRARTVAPLTLPAHASLFTAKYPPESGVRTNGRGRLDDTVPTLAEALRRQGYENGAFVASFVLDRKFGLDRGFTTYDDDFVGDEPATDAIHRQRSGEAVVDAALAWLGGVVSRPFFCWVHLYDPHAPYQRHAELFGDEFAERPYDAEIAYADRQVGRLVDFLKTRGLESRTLVVVVGDHGEGLGEHIEQTHGSTLYDATMHVPLIFYKPEELPQGLRIPDNVSIVDISPTILDLLGLKGLPKATGRSVKPAIRARDLPSVPCYGATDEPFLQNGWSPLRSLTDGEWKYIRTTKVELYDLANDPAERHNLADDDPGRVRAMEDLLSDIESRMVRREEVGVQLSANERRALASLGYAGGAAAVPAGAAPAGLPDVKDMLRFDVAVEESADLIRHGELSAAIGRLRDVIRQAPTHTAAYTFLAEALKRNQDFDEAAEVFAALLTVKPDCREGHYGLGNLLLERGRLDAAIDEFQKTLEIDPDYAEAHYNLAAALVHTGQNVAALDHFSAVLEIDRRNGAAYQGRANVLVSLGRVAEAVSDYQMALKYAPDAADAHHNLGIVLADYGDVDGARQHLRRAAELVPQNVQIQYSLGAFLVRQREYSQAIAPLVKVLEVNPDHAGAQSLLEEARQALKRRKSDPR
ncbi:MAG: tetratricopeptide repeat protein [Deltaproteobacteria bacterium]